MLKYYNIWIKSVSLLAFPFCSYIGIFYLQKLNWLHYSCIMLYSVLLYFSAKIPANAENCIRQRDFSAETRWFYLAPKHLCRFYHQFCFQIDAPRMLIVSWNVTYKPAPSNTNFQCVSQLNATSGCGSGLPWPPWGNSVETCWDALYPQLQQKILVYWAHP